MLGWNPTRTNIDRIISDAWGWYKTHKNGYEKYKSNIKLIKNNTNIIFKEINI